jgi:hypothetical protein
MPRQTLKPALLLLAIHLVAGGAAAQDEPDNTLVYYQVTYADGEVRDRFQPPESDSGVVSVVRIARVDSPLPQMRTVSTEVGVVLYNQPKVYRDDMKWDGQAWRMAREVAPRRKIDPEKVVAKALLAEATRVLKQLSRLQEQMPEARQELEDMRKLEKQQIQGPAAEALKRQLDRARKRKDALSEQIRAVQAEAEAIASQAEMFQNPRGEVAAPGQAQMGANPWGIDEPTGRRRVVGHRMQVWPLPAGQGTRAYRVSMAHAGAGMLGAFCYVAYADTDGDGAPDELIACSPLVTADKPGLWSSWTFQTRQSRVFVGNTWPGDRAAVYQGSIQGKGAGRNWHGLGGEVWVSGYFGGCPERQFTPYVTNLRVHLIPPDARP